MSVISAHVKQSIPRCFESLVKINGASQCQISNLSAARSKKKALTDTPCSAPASHSDWSAYQQGFARRALPRSPS